MFVVVCRHDGTILRADPEFARAVRCLPRAVPGRSLTEFLRTRRPFARLRRGAFRKVALTDCQGGKVDVWLRLADFRTGRTQLSIVLGERLTVRALGLESLSGWQSLNSIEGAVVTEDSQGFITFANSRFLELTGYSLRQLAGRHWTELVPPEVLSAVNRQLRVRARGGKSQYETQILTRGGRAIPVIVSARPILHRRRYQGTVSTFTDISEEKRVQDEIRTRSERQETLNRELAEQRRELLSLAAKLEQANRELKHLSEEKSDFVAAVSHDLRTPLTTIIGSLAMIEDGTLGAINPEQLRWLKLAREDAERLGDLIEDILDLAKIEAGKSKPSRTRVNIPDQVARVQRSYENLLREKRLTLDLEFPGRLPSVFCDEFHFARILTNLLSNAVKFTSPGGRITIQAAVEPPGMVRTLVRDTGMGIPQDQQNRVFGRFEQIRRDGAFRQPGSGLGLSLCKQLVELNHGAIGFTSEENKGSTFFFRLPVYPEVLPFPAD